ncbi:unnamed protein product [Tuber aestivum]|uniref:Uncharacterized protein n=1 Tax=Tuber aestivum TaxID=59557 RepID=A0A292PL04_9PEZI|nr:unnamed protein product [Tuber aestivum]
MAVAYIPLKLFPGLPKGQSKMLLPDLPTELLFEICSSPVLDIPDIVSALKTCRRLALALAPILIREVLKRRSNEYCRRALYHAAEIPSHFTVRFLLDNGALDILFIGPVLLNIAACILSEKGVTTLLDCGVDPNTLDGRGRTPLMCATGARVGGGVRALLANARVDVGSTWLFPDFTALHLAVWSGYDDIVPLFLESPRIDVNRVDNIQGTVLEAISSDSNTRVMATFVGSTILSLRIPLRRGWAPLHGAVLWNDCIILRALLRDERTDVNVLSLEGETALCMSVRFNNTFAVRLLLAHPKIQIHLGVRSILHFAVPWATKAVMEILLEDKRIDVNLVDQGQRTALHLAAALGRADVVESLLDRDGIDAEILDEEGRSAMGLLLSRAPKLARWFTIKLILENKGIEYLDLELGL